MEFLRLPILNLSNASCIFDINGHANALIIEFLDKFRRERRKWQFAEIILARIRCHPFLQKQSLLRLFLKLALHT